MKKFAFLLLFVSCNVFAQDPPRKALMGIVVKATPNGMQVDSVLPNGTFATTTVKKGDLITTLNGAVVNSNESYGKLASSIRTGDPVNIVFLRNGQSMNAVAKGVMKPYQQSELADLQYDWVKFRGGLLRAISWKPKAQTNSPAILLIPGYGCGSIENYAASYNGKLINEWLKAGYAVITIEKSGLGDSYNCLPCSEVDLKTDIESFNAGYQYMEQLPYVDKSRLYIWGHSMGGIIAPEVAKRHKPKGVMVFGTTFRPWSEFLLEMHRVQKPLLENAGYKETESFVRTIQKIYYEFFVLKKTREELLKNPEYRELVISELGYKENDNDMWGRHWRFWPQIDSLNLAVSWQSLHCPVLVLHGETDYESCSIAEPQLITAAVNAQHPGNATMIVVPQLDHFMMKSATWAEARDNFKQQQYLRGNFNMGIAVATINWLKQH